MGNQQTKKKKNQVPRTRAGGFSQALTQRTSNHQREKGGPRDSRGSRDACGWLSTTVAPVRPPWRCSPTTIAKRERMIKAEREREREGDDGAGVPTTVRRTTRPPCRRPLVATTKILVKGEETQVWVWVKLGPFL